MIGTCESCGVVYDDNDRMDGVCLCPEDGIVGGKSSPEYLAAQKELLSDVDGAHDLLDLLVEAQQGLCAYCHRPIREGDRIVLWTNRDGLRVDGKALCEECSDAAMQTSEDSVTLFDNGDGTFSHEVTP
jgi:hypothetical protein